MFYQIINVLRFLTSVSNFVNTGSYMHQLIFRRWAYSRISIAWRLKWTLVVLGQRPRRRLKRPQPNVRWRLKTRISKPPPPLRALRVIMAPARTLQKSLSTGKRPKLVLTARLMTNPKLKALPGPKMEFKMIPPRVKYLNPYLHLTNPRKTDRKEIGLLLIPDITKFIYLLASF